MKTRFFLIVLVVFVVAWVCLATAAVAVPWLVNYQGVLVDQTTGQGVTDTVTITFRLYDAEMDGTLLWEEAQAVQVDNGSFQVILGSTQAGGTLDPAIFRTEPLWMELWMAGDPDPMSPRMQMTSTPFAMRAWEAETAATETDPTVAASVKDGVAWSELSGIPAGFVDGVDNGLMTEADPTVAASVKDGVAWSELSGIPAGFADGVDNGIAAETDPTVLASVKDGVAWSEIAGIPAGFADGVDNGIATETDPQVGGNTTGFIPRWNGSALVSGLLFDSGGGIGLGTASPGSLLELESWMPIVTLDTTNTTAGFDIRQNGVHKWRMAWDAGSQYLFFWGSGAGTSLVIQDGTGNVGVGTALPTRKLDVNGSLAARSGYGDAIILGGDNTGADVEIGIQAPADRNTVSFWNHQTQTFADVHTREAMVTVLHITSDAKYKTDIRTIDGALDTVSRLRGVEFEWRRDAFPHKGFSQGRKIGLIAQEVEAVLPELVAECGGGKGVEYPNLVAVLIEAVKELKAQNEALRERVDALEGSRWIARTSRD